MNKFLFAVTFFISALLLSFQSHADPISKEEAQEWLQRVSRGLGIPVHQIESYIKNDELRTREQLKTMPSSMAFNRDLADNLHRLGHMAEHEHDYEKALVFHLESLELYKKTGILQSMGSPDGVLHALEHVFMDYYDEAVLLVQNDKDDKAEELYDKAYDWAQEHSLLRLLFNRSPRFPQRYLGLLLYRTENLKSLTALDEKVLSSVSCSMHLMESRKKSK